MISIKTLLDIVLTRNANEVVIDGVTHAPETLLLKNFSRLPPDQLEMYVTTEFMRFPPPLAQPYRVEPWPDNLPLKLI